MEKIILGKCPKCGNNIVGGMYGPYCENKCGMQVSKAFGKDLTEDQVKDLLEGKQIEVKDLQSKKGTTYDAILVPNGIEDYTYTRKDGETVNAARFKFAIEFPKHYRPEIKEDDEEITDQKGGDPNEPVTVGYKAGEDDSDFYKVSDEELSFN